MAFRASCTVLKPYPDPSFSRASAARVAVSPRPNSRFQCIAALNGREQISRAKNVGGGPSRSAGGIPRVASMDLDMTAVAPLGPFCALRPSSEERLTAHETGHGRLPAEVEALANFTDAPERCRATGWLSWWRYQGL